MGDIFIRFVSFPTLRVYGATALDENGDYNIFIDERLSNEKKLETYKHEVLHIKNRHFDPSISSQEAEEALLQEIIEF
ncbi:MAG: hypothetical protein WCP73_03660 [Eubacteriales bacterium]